MTRTARLIAATAVALLVPFGASAVEAAPAQAPPPATVTVRTGDSLAGIAVRLGVRLSALLRANDLTLVSVIHPGDTLVVPPGVAGAPTGRAAPAPAPTASPGTGATTYTVVAGDALARIAQRNGVKLGALLKANNLTTASLIVPGRVLTIPPATMPIPTATPTTPTTPVVTAASTATNVDAMLTFLRSQVGAPYRFFSAGPDAYDCSGLVVAGFRSIGRSVPHQSRSLARIGVAIDWRTEPIAPGDLVFTSVHGDPDQITHVGVALDSRTWIHAVGVGRTVTIAALPGPDKIMVVRRIALG